MKIDLEGLGLREEHADYLLICGDIVVVVEETSGAKIADLRKLEKTLELIVSGSIQLADRNPRKIYMVVHAERRVDPMLPKLMATRSRRDKIYAICNCDLISLLRRYGVECRRQT